MYTRVVNKFLQLAQILSGLPFIWKILNKWNPFFDLGKILEINNFLRNPENGVKLGKLVFSFHIASFSETCVIRMFKIQQNALQWCSV